MYDKCWCKMDMHIPNNLSYDIKQQNTWYNQNKDGVYCILALETKWSKTFWKYCKMTFTQPKMETQSCKSELWLEIQLQSELCHFVKYDFYNISVFCFAWVVITHYICIHQTLDTSNFDHNYSYKTNIKHQCVCKNLWGNIFRYTILIFLLIHIIFRL